MENERIESVEHEELTTEEIIDIQPEQPKKKKRFKKELEEGSFSEIGQKLEGATNFKEKISILFRHKKTNAAVKLGAYVIFFAVIAIFFRLMSNGVLGGDTITPEDPYQNLKDTINYGYNIVLTQEEDSTITYNGLYKGGVSLFTINEQKYYFEGGVYYEIVNNEKVPLEASLIPSLEHFSPNVLVNLLEYLEDNFDEETTTRDKNNNYVERVFKTSSNEIATVFFEVNAGLEENTLFKVRYEDGKPVGFEIDSSDEPIAGITNIKITYHSFDAVTEDQVLFTNESE